MFGAKPSSLELNGPQKTVAPKSGVEVMLRSMGLAEVLDAARELASSGSVAKIIGFSEGLDTLNARLDELERGQREILEFVRYGFQRGNVEPGSDTGDTGSPARTSRRKSAPEEPGAD